MCDMAYCGPVVDWRRGNLPGEVLGLLGWLMAWLCLLDCSLLFIAANVCLLMLGNLQLHDICI